MARRRKDQAADPLPSREEALAMLARYAALTREAALTRLALDEAIAAAKAAAQAELAPIEADARQLFDRLRDWWASAKDVEAPGRRSAELAGVTLGQRLTPPSLNVARAIDIDALLATLKRDFPDLLRTRVEIDKSAILGRLLNPALAAPITAPGFAIKTRDEFFIAVPEEAPPSSAEHAAAE